jgi:signal peptidase I
MESNTSHLKKENYMQWLASLLKEGQSARVKVKGLSMLPWLIPGDGITLQPINKRELRVGQVIVFQGENNWIAHRLIKINPENSTYITRGDANLHHDRPLSLHQIKGIVVLVSPKHFFWSNMALGKNGKYLVTLQPYTAPPFWLAGRIAIGIRHVLKQIGWLKKTNTHTNDQSKFTSNL